MIATKQRFLSAIHTGLSSSSIAPDDITDVAFQTGRNFSALIELKDGSKLYAKQLRGMFSDLRLKRTLQFDSWFRKQSVGFSSPNLLGSDSEQRTVVFEYQSSEKMLENEIRDLTVDFPTLENVARALVEFHLIPVTDPSTLDQSLPEFPPRGLAVMSLDYLDNSTMGELDLWRLVQADAALQEALTNLQKESTFSTPIHGDFRPDQILISDHGISIIDWEEFRFGEPARDLGTFLGEIFFHGMRTLASGLPSSDESPTEEDIVVRGEELLTTVRPFISAFWTAYQNHGTEIVKERGKHSHLSTNQLRELATRTVGYMGWHLFDRSLVASAVAGRLSAHDRALNGIGRNLIINRKDFVDTVGLRTDLEEPK